uniref:Uncharacterized protein n=1 Tax=Arundo donax TaxID=35708 RepID=A0A0A9QMA7_ARUDO
MEISECLIDQSNRKQVHESIAVNFSSFNFLAAN